MARKNKNENPDETGVPDPNEPPYDGPPPDDEDGDDGDGDGEDEGGASAAAESLPDGFSRVNPVDGERHWFTPKKGAAMQGILLGRYARRDKPTQFYYQIRLTRPCEFVKNAKGESVELDRGAVVMLDEREGLRDLEPLTRRDPSHGSMEVVVKSVEKIKTRSGNSFWRWAVGSRVAK